MWPAARSGAPCNGRHQIARSAPRASWTSMVLRTRALVHFFKIDVRRTILVHARVRFRRLADWETSPIKPSAARVSDSCLMTHGLPAPITLSSHWHSAQITQPRHRDWRSPWVSRNPLLLRTALPPCAAPSPSRCSARDSVAAVAAPAQLPASSARDSALRPCAAPSVCAARDGAPPSASMARRCRPMTPPHRLIVVWMWTRT